MATVTGLVFALILALGFAAVRAPWWDEGLYGNVGWQLSAHGRFGSSLMGATGSFGYDDLPRMNEATYWTTPLYPVLVALVFHVGDVSVFGLRLVSIACTVGLVAAWSAIVRRLTGSMSTALVAAALVALNSHVLYSATLARPEAPGTALAALAVLLYLSWRDTHALRAGAAAGALFGAAALAHPLVIVESLALAAMVLVLDGRRALRPAPLLAAAAAGLLMLVPWAAYIAQDPETFRAQWSANLAGRTSGLSSPVSALLRDLPRRYVEPHFTGMQGVARLYVLELVAVVGALACVALRARLRHTPGAGALLAATGTAWAALALLDGTYFPQYVAHVYPLLMATGAIAVAGLAAGTGRERLLATALVLGMVAPGVGGILRGMAQRPYQTEYAATARQIDALLARGALVSAGSEFGFALGFDATFRDDIILRTPADVFVRSQWWHSTIQRRGLDARLEREFVVAARHARYTVFVRRSAVPRVCAGAGAAACPLAL